MIFVIAMTITIVSAVACFLAKKRKQRNSSDYSYTTNLTYNVRSGRTGIEDESEGNSDSQQPSTMPYYDYIEDGTPNPPRSESMERVLSSSGSNDSMEQIGPTGHIKLLIYIILVVQVILWCKIKPTGCTKLLIYTTVVTHVILWYKTKLTNHITSPQICKIVL